MTGFPVQHAKDWRLQQRKMQEYHTIFLHFLIGFRTPPPIG